MLVGDCAGLVNPSIHHEGTNLAMASGVYAAEAFLEARDKGDMSKPNLAAYRRRLDESWVMKDLAHYRDAVHFLSTNREMVDDYQRLAVEAIRDYFTVGQYAEGRSPKPRDSQGARRGCVPAAWRGRCGAPAKTLM